MRLICPNCGAQYEVEASMIPADGRDVQCSNCATTWFQDGTRRSAPPPPDSAEPATKAPKPTLQDEEAPAQAPPSEAAALPPRPRPQASAADLDILREEAEQESRLRANPATPLETQGDLGIDDKSATDRALQARARRIRRPGAPAPEADPDQEPAAPIAPAQAPPEAPPEAPVRTVASRRNLLPDIEEINSTLRPNPNAETSDEDAALRDAINQGRGATGARRGFSVMVMMASLALAIYIWAPTIAARIPATAPMLSSYQTWVDDLRRGLDAAVGKIADRLGDAANSRGNGG